MGPSWTIRRRKLLLEGPGLLIESVRGALLNRAKPGHAILARHTRPGGGMADALA
jgi:hypothetical protein